MSRLLRSAVSEARSLIVWQGTIWCTRIDVRKNRSDDQATRDLADLDPILARGRKARYGHRCQKLESTEGRLPLHQ